MAAIESKVKQISPKVLKDFASISAGRAFRRQERLAIKQAQMQKTVELTLNQGERREGQLRAASLLGLVQLMANPKDTGDDAEFFQNIQEMLSPQGQNLKLFYDSYPLQLLLTMDYIGREGENLDQFTNSDYGDLAVNLRLGHISGVGIYFRERIGKGQIPYLLFKDNVHKKNYYYISDDKGYSVPAKYDPEKGFQLSPSVVDDLALDRIYGVINEVASVCFGTRGMESASLMGEDLLRLFYHQEELRNFDLV